MGAPLLQLVQVEPGPDQELPLLALRAYRHTETDPAPLASAVAFPTLNVDGQDRRPGVIAWSGPIAPLRVGGYYAYLLDLSRYTWITDPKMEKPIEAARTYVIFAKVGDRQSNRIILGYDRGQSEAWDQATPTVVPAAEPRVMLNGTITGPDGTPAAAYGVSLVAGENRLRKKFHEQTNAEGRYEVLNVPAGPYRVTVNPMGKGQPALTISSVLLHPNRPPHMQRNFWDATLAAPFPEASYVGLSGTGAKPKPLRNVTAERQDVDFSL